MVWRDSERCTLDLAVCAKPPEPNTRSWTSVELPLHLLRAVELGLALSTRLAIAACIVGPVLGVHVPRAVYVSVGVGYALSLTACFSTSVLRWLVFGHPFSRLGVAHSAGPFDRGARLCATRDFSRPAAVGLHNARCVRITTADGETGLRRLLEEVTPIHLKTTPNPNLTMTLTLTLTLTLIE